MHNNKKAVICKVRWLATPLLFTLASSLMLASATLPAKESSPADTGWSEWKGMGAAYVARRRQPPKLNAPKEERRQVNVQARIEKTFTEKHALRLQHRETEKTNNRAKAGRYGDFSQVFARQTAIAAAPGNAQQDTNSRQAARAERIQGLSEEQASALSQRDDSLARRENARNSNRAAVWLNTGEAGLVSVSIAELATTFNQSESKIRNRAQQGKLNLITGATSDAKAAKQAVSWYFDELGDSVLFAATAHNSFYSDENAFKLRLGGKKALPMTVADGAITQNFGSETPFNDTIKFEQEPDFLYSTWTVAEEADADFWFWDYLYAGSKDEINVSLTVPNPAPGGAAQLRVTLRGWTDMYDGDEHEVSAEINGTPVGSSVIWDAFDEAVLVADFDQSLLNASTDNTLTLRNHHMAGETPGQWLDQVEIDYLRSPVALNDKLWMRNVAVGTQAVSGFSSDNIVVIEDPAGAATLRRDVRVTADGSGDWQAVFDAVGGSDFLLVEGNALTVASLAADNNARLGRRDNNADYLIIAPREFADTANTLATHRSSRFSYVKIVWLDDIYHEFSAGRADPAALGRFMTRAIKKWGVAPASVVLLGKGSLDQLDRMGYSDSFLPIVMTSTPWALASSDSKLLGFEDDAPFTIGRLPITNDSEGLAYLAKLATYESTSSGSTRLEAVLAADNPDDAGDFHANSELLVTRLLDNLGFDMVTTLYHPESDVRAGLIDSATWNTGYVSYDGHGSVAQIGDHGESFITAVDASLLTNTSYPVFTALTCAAGDDTLPGTRSLAAALVLNPGGGAIASVAPTGLSLDNDAQLLGNELVDSLYGSSETVGAALRNAKIATSINISEFMPRMYSVVGVPEVYAR